MIHGITVIETILLAITGLVLCLGMFRILCNGTDEQYSTSTAIFFLIAVLTQIIGIGLLWI